jgi:hypothetical protein
VAEAEMSSTVKARVAIVLGVGSLALAAAPAALADPTPLAPADGASFTARVGQITFQASSAVSPSPGRIDFYVSRDSLVDPDGLLSNPFYTTHAGPDTGVPPLYTAGPDSDVDWPNKPGTYHWQPVYHDCSQADPNCFAPPQSLTINPLPAPTQNGPATGVTIPYGGHRSFSVHDVPSYARAGTRLYIEFSRSTALDPDGTFANRYLLAPPDPAAGSTYTYRFGRPFTKAPGTYYWLVERFDCAAEPDCFVTDDSIRSFTVAKRPPPTSQPAPKTYLTRHPPHRTHRHRVRFAFTSNVHRARFQCYYTGGWTHCSSPERFRHLKPGRYRFKVRAVAHGKRDRTPSKCFFRVVRRHHRR